MVLSFAEKRFIVWRLIKLAEAVESRRTQQFAYKPVFLNVSTSKVPPLLYTVRATAFRTHTSPIIQHYFSFLLTNVPI